MRITATHIVAAIVCTVGALGFYAHLTAPEPSSKVTQVKHKGMAEDYMQWLDKCEGAGK